MKSGNVVNKLTETSREENLEGKRLGLLSENRDKKKSSMVYLKTSGIFEEGNHSKHSVDTTERVISLLQILNTIGN